MSDEPKYRDENWLREQYVEEWKTTREIAEECGCCKTTIRNWLNEHDIETGGIERAASDQRLTDRNWLREQYVEEERSLGDIAEECGCHRNTVHRWIKRHGIDLRGLERRLADQRLTDREWMREQHVEQRMSCLEIAEKCGCSEDTARKWLKRHNIELLGNARKVPDQRLTDPDWLREQYVEQEMTHTDIAEECGCSFATVYRWLNEHDIEKVGNLRKVPDRRLTDADWLHGRYVDRRRSMADIAEECGCSREPVRNWLIKHGIETRDPSDWSGLTGSDHPDWNGGPKHYGPGWNDRKRREVRERDGQACQDPRCSITQADHLDKYGKKLHVHHLRKARDVEDPEKRNAKENLITLCLDCHRRWEKIADTGLVPEVSR